MDELMASPTAPMPEKSSTYILTKVYQGLAAIEKEPEPTLEDWQACSDAINMTETLVLEMRVCEDRSGLLQDCINAMALAGKRYLAGASIRLDGAGIQAVRAVVEDFAYLITTLPHRTMVTCHRLTEKRIHRILNGQSQPHDKTVVAL
jgi:hypothetical protein